MLITLNMVSQRFKSCNESRGKFRKHFLRFKHNQCRCLQDLVLVFVKYRARALFFLNVLDKTRRLSCQQRCISSYLTVNPNVGIANWACVGKKLGLVPLKNTWKAMEGGSLLRLGSGPDSRHHYHVHAGTLTEEPLGWAGSDIFSEGSLLALLSLAERRYQTCPIPALYFKSLWVIFLSHIPHQSASQISFTPSKPPLCYWRYLSSWSWFLFLFLWVFWSCLSESSHIKYWANEPDVEFDPWRYSISIPFFLAV